MELKSVIDYYIAQAVRLTPSFAIEDQIKSFECKVFAPDGNKYSNLATVLRSIPSEHSDGLPRTMLRLARAHINTAINIVRDEIRIRALSAIYCLDRLDGAAEREADELRVMLEKIAEPYNTPTLADVSQVQKQAERISYTIRAEGREPVLVFAEDIISQVNWIHTLLEMIS